MLPSSVLLILGLFGLWLGSSVLVDSARDIARSLHISELIIGLTIISIGSTVPETATNIMAGLSNLHGVEASGIAVGNVLGSMMANITLILGICGLSAAMHIGKPLKRVSSKIGMDKVSLKREGLALIGAITAFFLVSFDGYISRIESLFLVLLYLAYLGYLLKTENIKKRFALQLRDKTFERHFLFDLFLILIGLVLIVHASNIVVTNGVFLASSWGIEETIIGLFIGLGTSLPELTIAFMGLLKNSAKLSIGNLMGATIADPLIPLGFGGIIAGFSVARTSLLFDIPVVFFSILLVLTFLRSSGNLNKKESVTLILVYFLFMYFRLTVV